MGQDFQSHLKTLSTATNIFTKKMQGYKEKYVNLKKKHIGGLKKIIFLHYICANIMKDPSHSYLRKGL